MTRRGITAIVFVVMLALPVSGAQAHDKAFGASLTLDGVRINGTGATATAYFFGRVQTSEVCEERRKVTVYRTADSTPVAKGVSRSGGRFKTREVPASAVPSGQYFARVSRVVREGRDHVHTCGDARAKSLVVGG